ncbi:hypothetical protein VTN00DRAFT_7788 [Thermoascus crustaceus]|uniref:uncharacterized protein n=1 Tax=Thermoascus crustaceus TaxID=5088 RepID=UPI0037435425
MRVWRWLMLSGGAHECSKCRQPAEHRLNFRLDIRGRTLEGRSTTAVRMWSPVGRFLIWSTKQDGVPGGCFNSIQRFASEGRGLFLSTRAFRERVSPWPNGREVKGAVRMSNMANNPFWTTGR